MNFIDKLKSTKQGRKVYERERVLFEATELIARAMKIKGITEAELAKRLGVTKSYITSLLEGKNITLVTLSDVLFALDHRVILGSKS